MKKRLLVIQQYFYPDVSAVSQLLGDLLQELARTGRYDITVLATSVVRQTWHGALPRRLGPVRIRRVPTPNAGRTSLLHRVAENALYYISVFLHVLWARGYDCVVSLTTPPLIGFVVSLAMTFDRRPLVYYVEDLYPELLLDMGMLRAPWLVKKLALFNRVTLRRASRVVGIGPYMARKLWCNYGYRRTEVVPNWTAFVEYADPPPGDHFVIAYAGNLGLAHDFELLEPLLVGLRDVPAIEYRFIGAGRAYGAVQRMFARAGERRCRFTGYVERADHGRLLSEAHVFLMAQSDQTVGDILPSKYYSYLAAGRPILFFGTRKSEVGEETMHEGVGCVVECAADVKRAAELVKTLMSDRDFYLSLCRRGAALYAERYGLARSARRFHEILREVTA